MKGDGEELGTTGNTTVWRGCSREHGEVGEESQELRERKHRSRVTCDGRKDGATLAAAWGGEEEASGELQGLEVTATRAAAVGPAWWPPQNPEVAVLRPTSELNGDFLHKQAAFVAVEKGSPVLGPHSHPRGPSLLSAPPTTAAPVNESLSVSVSLSRVHARTYTHAHTQDGGSFWL